MNGESGERTLIEAAAAGDERAFEVLFDRHAAAVMSLAAMRLGDRSRAYDVTQEVFLRLHRSLPAFRHESALRTWLVRITLNCCTDLERTRHRIASREHQSDRLDAIAGAAPAPVDHDECGLRAAVERLPPELRLLVSLRYDAELTYAEIAQVLAMPHGTVATRLARALRTLRSMLEPGRVT